MDGCTCDIYSFEGQRYPRRHFESILRRTRVATAHKLCIARHLEFGGLGEIFRFFRISLLRMSLGVYSSVVFRMSARLRARASEVCLQG